MEPTDPYDKHFDPSDGTDETVEQILTVENCRDCGRRDFLGEGWTYCGEDEHGSMYMCPSCTWDARHEDEDPF